MFTIQSYVYGTFEVTMLLASLATYFVWLLFVLAITLLMSAAFNTGVATACAFVIIFVGQIVDAIVGTFWTVSPWKLPGYGVQLIRGTMEMPDYWWSLVVTAVLLLICVVLGIYVMKKIQRWRKYKDGALRKLLRLFICLQLRYRLHALRRVLECLSL